MFSECFMTCYYTQTNNKLIVEMFSPASSYSTVSKIQDNVQKELFEKC